MDKDSLETCWGPLSRHSAGKAVRLWEDMRGEVHVFLEKDGQRKEDKVEKRVGKGKPCFWFVEDPNLPRTKKGETTN